MTDERIPINSTKDEVIELLTDSQAAHDHITKNLTHPRTKHIKRRFNYTRDAYHDGDIDLRRIPASEQTADVLTKILGPIAHQNALKLLNMKSFSIPV